MGSESESRSRQHCCVGPSVFPASAEPNHFFKIILPEAIHGKKLWETANTIGTQQTALLKIEGCDWPWRIPKEFIKRFGNELSSVATVTVPDGLVWKMGLKKSTNEVWFCDGWQEFVKYYSISYGSILVFKYEGNSNFCVVIFDMTAAEIYYPFKNQSNNGEPNFENQHSVCPRKRSILDHRHNDTRSKWCKLENPEEIIDVDNINEQSHGKSRKEVSCNLHQHSGKHGKERYGQGHSERMSLSSKLENQEEIIDVENVNSPSHGKSRTNASHNSHERMSDSSCKMESLTLKKKKRAIKASRRFKPKNPSFTAILKPSSINCYLYVPASFAAKYLRKMDSVKLQDSNGQQWVVHCSYCKDKCSAIRLRKGWIDFARDNHLSEGDVCVFEIIKRKGIVLKVTIFRCF